MAGLSRFTSATWSQTTSGTHHGEGVIGVLYENGSFELINAARS